MVQTHISSQHDTLFPLLILSSEAIAKTKSKLQDEINTLQEKLDEKTDQVLSLRKENDDLKCKISAGIHHLHPFFLLFSIVLFVPSFIWDVISIPFSPLLPFRVYLNNIIGGTSGEPAGAGNAGGDPDYAELVEKLTEQLENLKKSFSHNESEINKVCILS